MLSKKENVEIKDNKLERRLKIVLAIVGTFLFLQLLFITYMLGIYKYIYKGVWVGNIDLSGLTRKEAIVVLSEKYKGELEDKKVIFKHREYEKEVSVADIISDIDYEKIALDARQIGREGTLINRFYTVLRLRREKIDIQPRYVINITELRKQIYEIKQELDKDMKEAIITKNPNEDFKIVPDEIGINVLIEETIDKVKEHIENGDEIKEIELVVEEELPTLTKEYANNFSTLLGEYKTSCSGSSYGRLENLKNASKKINGTILLPDAIFSVNDTISPVDEKNGYKAAQVIYNGTIVNGIGGGICQISSTLYNAVLFSELEVVERRNHSLTVAYAPLARDAAISIGTLDFKFKNSSTSPIYIESYVLNGEVVMKIYGKGDYKKYDKIELLNKVIKRIAPLDDIITYDENLAPGQRIVDSKGVSGYVAELYRKCYIKDELVAEELVNTSRYSPTAAKIRVSESVE